MRVCVWILALAGALAPALLSAQEGPLILRAGGSVYWDSNVYRLQDSAPDPQVAGGAQGKSDRYALAYVGLSFEKSYSLQRLTLDLTNRVIRYQKFDTLDRDELDYRGEWQMRLGSRVSGALRADRTESLIGFEDARGQQQNVSVITNNAVSLDGRLSSYWHLLGAVSEMERRNRQTFLALPNSRQTGGDVGLRFLSTAQNSVTLMVRSRQGSNDIPAVDFVNFIDDSFDVRESELSVFWASGGYHSLTGRLTRTAYRYDNLPQRDFSGTAGELRHTWTLTAALTLHLSAQRALSPWTADTTASYRIDDTFALAPSWQFSEKTTIEGRVYRMTSEFRGAVASGVGQGQRDIQQGLRLGVQWLPLRRVHFGASLQHEKRTSTLETLNFDATIIGLDASLRF